MGGAMTGGGMPQGEMTGGSMETPVADLSNQPTELGEFAKKPHLKATTQLIMPPEGAENEEGVEWWSYKIEVEVILTLAAGRVPTLIEQEMIFRVLPPTEFAGQKISVYAYNLTETKSNRVVRSIKRTYTPAYTLVLDSEMIPMARETELTRMVTVSEEITQKDFEPMTNEYPLEVKVIVDPMPQVLRLWGELTDNIYQITVQDEQTRGIVRSFWVKPGLGIVRLYDRTLGSNSFDLWLGNDELFELPNSDSEDSENSEELNNESSEESE